MTHAGSGTPADSISSAVLCKCRLAAYYAVLKGLKGDIDALKVKVFALLMIGRFQEALDLIKSTTSLQKQSVLEHAYCLYKCGELAAALELLVSSDDEASLQLTAMVHMRAGNAEEAADAYRKLVPKVAADKQSRIELVRGHAIVCRCRDIRVPKVACDPYNMFFLVAEFHRRACWTVYFVLCVRYQ